MGNYRGTIGKSGGVKHIFYLLYGSAKQGEKGGLCALIGSPIRSNQVTGFVCDALTPQ